MAELGNGPDDIVTQLQDEADRYIAAGEAEKAQTSLDAAEAIINFAGADD